MLVGAHEVLMTASGFDLPLKSMEIVCMAVGYRLGHMRGSILPDSLNVRATGKEVESCALYPDALTHRGGRMADSFRKAE